MPVFVIRRTTDVGDGRFDQHEASVIAENAREALRASREGRVRAWQYSDTIDELDCEFSEFEVLNGSYGQARKALAQRPIPTRFDRSETDDDEDEEAEERDD